jgi:hypothetical protein
MIEQEIDARGLRVTTVSFQLIAIVTPGGLK